MYHFLKESNPLLVDPLKKKILLTGTYATSSSGPRAIVLMEKKDFDHKVPGLRDLQ